MSNTTETTRNGRIVHLYGHIDNEKARAVCEEIYALARESDANIDMWIDSDGGDISAGFKVVDMVEAVRPHVIATIIGRAGSMAYVVAAACAWRRIMGHAKVRLHMPCIDGERLGSANAEQLRKIADAEDRIAETLAAYIAGRTGAEPAAVRAAMEADQDISADDAQRLGFVSAVIAARDTNEADAGDEAEEKDEEEEEEEEEEVKAG